MNEKDKNQIMGACLWACACFELLMGPLFLQIFVQICFLWMAGDQIFDCNRILNEDRIGANNSN